MLSRAIVFLLLVVNPIFSAFAVADDPPRRLYFPPREDESWAFLRRPQAPRDWWDPLKYVPLAGDSYLSFGGEAREQIELYDHEAWGVRPGTDVYLLQRYLVHADAHLTRYLRIFAQLESSLEDGRDGGPHPQIDRDLLDVNQAWAELDAVPGATPDDAPTLSLRAGRQELSFGAGRLLSIRELNVRQPFDGVRLTGRLARWRADAFFVLPVTINLDVLDDKIDRTQKLWGLYTTGWLDGKHRLGVDGYYLGLARDKGVFDRGSGPEQRHTIGARLFAAASGFDGDLEGALQLGRFDALPILAWFGVLTAGYSHTLGPLGARLGVAAAVASGDSGDGTLRTFDSFYPRGDYFGASKTMGPSNTAAAHQNLTLRLPAGFRFAEKLWLFWRESTRDGIYNIAGFPLRPPGSSTARYIGPQLELDAGWSHGDHLDLALTSAWFWAGDYIRASGPGRDTLYASFIATYRF